MLRALSALCLVKYLIKVPFMLNLISICPGFLWEVSQAVTLLAGHQNSSLPLDRLQRMFSAAFGLVQVLAEYLIAA